MARKTSKNVQKYDHLTKGCCPQGASKADKSVLRRSQRIPKLLVESISILKLINHNFSHHYFYIAIITYILVQYCGYYLSESNCKPDQKETCCEGESVPIQTNKLRLFIWYNSCTRLDKWLILWLYFWRNWSNVQIKNLYRPIGQRICRTGCTFVDICMWIFRRIQNILWHRCRGRPSTRLYAPSLPQSEVSSYTTAASVSSNENCGTGAVAIAICQFLSTTRQWIVWGALSVVIDLTAVVFSRIISWSVYYPCF